MKKKRGGFLFVSILTLSLQGCAAFMNPSQNPDTSFSSAESHVELGLAYLDIHDIPRAKENLLKALHTSPSSSHVQAAMAYFFETTGDTAHAEQYYQKAVHHPLPDGAALNNYGVFLCRQHRSVEAEKMFLAAAHQTAYLNTAQAYKNAGLCALSEGNTAKANHYFEKAQISIPAGTLLNK